jgi:hypothetical protein
LEIHTASFSVPHHIDFTGPGRDTPFSQYTKANAKYPKIQTPNPHSLLRLFLSRTLNIMRHCLPGQLPVGPVLKVISLRTSQF